MRNGIYYLNNSGSRFLVLDDGKKEKIVILKGKTSPFQDTCIIRTPLFYESFGNHTAVTYKYKGERYSTLDFMSINRVQRDYEPFELLFHGHEGYFSGSARPQIWIETYKKQTTAREIYERLQDEINSIFDHLVHTYAQYHSKSEKTAQWEVELKTEQALTRFKVDNLHQWNKAVFTLEEKPEEDWPISLVFTF